MVNFVETLRAEGQSRIHIGDNVYKANDKCLADLRSTDPSDDKTRIERTKGGLLKDAYRWILRHADFQRWRDDRESRVLWIHGDPGKGKTMLLIGVIEELEQQPKQSTGDAWLLSYFFCQGTDSRLNNATAVLRGLIYLLLTQEASLTSYIQEKYKHAGKQPFEDVNAFDALSKIFANMLQDSNLKGAYMIIDALDECETGLPQLLGLIVQIASISSHVKWIVSSRNRSDIEARLSLNDAHIRLSLELNTEHISRATEMFVNYKVSQLASIKHDSTLQEKVRNQMHEKANGTFLWVAFVFQELEQVDSWDVLQVLGEVPADLHLLYDRMMTQVQQLKRKDPEFCRLILSAMTLVYRPLHLLELGILSGLPGQISNNLDSIMKIVGKCGSFLTIREDYVYFIHQSAKDYLDSNVSGAIFPSGRVAYQYDLFSRSIQAVSGTLHRNMYGLRQLGISIDLAKPPHPDPLAPLRYPCVYWASHFHEAYRNRVPCRSDLTDGGKIHFFLQKHFLYWLEALSLMKSMSSSVETISTLLTLLKVSLDFR
jgi:NACHT domain